MSARLLWLLCALGASAPAARAAAELPPARVVIVIGYNGGAPDPRPPLSFADDDAARLFLQLGQASERAFLLTTFDRESARLFPQLTDVAREPTRESLARVIGESAWLLRRAKAEGRMTELVLAFAGHGDVSDAGEGYILFSDGPFLRSDLERQVLAPSPADTNHVIIDACASYFMVNSRGGDKSAPAKELTPRLLDVLAGNTDDAALRARTGVFVSTSSAAEVHESRELASGVFSFLLRSAVAGAADANGDGRVEYAEAAAFITQASGDLDDPRARLSVYAAAPLQHPHAALLDLRSSGATQFLAVDAGADVHLRILDAHGLPYAEMHSSGERAVLLTLTGNPFFVVQRGGEEAVLVPRGAGAYALSSLTFEAAPAARGGAGPFVGLFRQPLDRGFLRGFLAAAASTSLAPPAAGEPFAVAYAERGAPPLKLPLGALSATSIGAAAVLGAGAGVALALNQMAFADLDAHFQKTGQLDPELSLNVERWRTATTALSLGALGTGLLGAGLFFWSTQDDDVRVEVR